VTRDVSRATHATNLSVDGGYDNDDAVPSRNTTYNTWELCGAAAKGFECVTCTKRYDGRNAKVLLRNEDNNNHNHNHNNSVVIDYINNVSN
jgi:hypothetical protein